MWPVVSWICGCTIHKARQLTVLASERSVQVSQKWQFLVRKEREVAVSLRWQPPCNTQWQKDSEKTRRAWNSFPCGPKDGILVSFLDSVGEKKYLIETNLREKGFIPAHSSKFSPLWQGSQGRTWELLGIPHSPSRNREMIVCMITPCLLSILLNLGDGLATAKMGLPTSSDMWEYPAFPDPSLGKF